MHCCCVLIRTLALARLSSCFTSEITTQYIGIGLLLCFMHTVIYLFKMKSYIKVHKQKFKKIQENYKTEK